MTAEKSIKEVIEDIRKTGPDGEKMADLLTETVNREIKELVDSIKAEYAVLMEIAEQNGYERGYNDGISGTISCS